MSKQHQLHEVNHQSTLLTSVDNVNIMVSTMNGNYNVVPSETVVATTTDTSKHFHQVDGDIFKDISASFICERAYNTKEPPQIISTDNNIDNLDDDNEDNDIQSDFTDATVVAIRCLSMEHCRLRHIGLLPSCTNLSVLYLAENFLTSIDGLDACSGLLLLDLHNNHIRSLPGREFWLRLKKLRILYLHNNQLDKFTRIEGLVYLPKLTVLTCYDTPLALEKHYRHQVVNVLPVLRAFDNIIVADSEVIESISFEGEFASFSTIYKSNLYLPMVPTTSSENVNDLQVTELDFWYKNAIANIVSYGIAAEKRVYGFLRFVSNRCGKTSPILFIQRCIRGWLARRWVNYLRGMRVWAAVIIQRTYREYRYRNGIKGAAASMIQHAYRQYRRQDIISNFVVAQTSSLRAHSCAIYIQRYWRASHGRTAPLSPTTLDLSPNHSAAALMQAQLNHKNELLATIRGAAERGNRSNESKIENRISYDQYIRSTEGVSTLIAKKEGNLNSNDTSPNNNLRSLNDSLSWTSSSIQTKPLVNINLSQLTTRNKAGSAGKSSLKVVMPKLPAINSLCSNERNSTDRTKRGITWEDDFERDVNASKDISENRKIDDDEEQNSLVDVYRAFLESGESTGSELLSRNSASQSRQEKSHMSLIGTSQNLESEAPLRRVLLEKLNSVCEVRAESSHASKKREQRTDWEEIEARIRIRATDGHLNDQGRMFQRVQATMSLNHISNAQCSKALRDRRNRLQQAKASKVAEVQSQLQVGRMKQALFLQDKRCRGGGEVLRSHARTEKKIENDCDNIKAKVCRMVKSKELQELQQRHGKAKATFHNEFVKAHNTMTKHIVISELQAKRANDSLQKARFSFAKRIIDNSRRTALIQFLAYEYFQKRISIESDHANLNMALHYRDKERRRERDYYAYQHASLRNQQELTKKNMGINYRRRDVVHRPIYRLPSMNLSSDSIGDHSLVDTHTTGKFGMAPIPPVQRKSVSWHQDVTH